MKLGPGIGGKSLDNTCILFNMTLGKTPKTEVPKLLLLKWVSIFRSVMLGLSHKFSPEDNWLISTQ
jgi:hypothetical protein